jgi:hypothetical protein
MAQRKTKKSYRPHWERDRENPPKFELQERDKELIELVFRHRFLTSDQVAELYLMDHAGEGYSVRGVKYRLFVLFHAGYLQKPAQARLLRYLEGKNLPHLYGIGPKARTILRQRGYGEGQIKAALESPTHYYLQHSLMVSSFHLALEKALRARPEWQLHFFKHESKEIRDSWGKKDRRGYEWSVNPDAYFALKGPEGTMYYFLEADRGTVSPGRFRWKVNSYTQFWREGRQTKDKFGMPYTKDKRGELKPKAFKVLIVTVSEERKERLRQLVREADPRGRGLRLFWFTTEEAYRVDPARILNSIWQWAGEEAKYSMLERSF